MADSNSGSSGIGLCGVVFVVFLVLKLTKVIAWSWWWVTCPLWAIPALLVVGLLIAIPFIIIAKRKTR